MMISSKSVVAGSALLVAAAGSIALSRLLKSSSRKTATSLTEVDEEGELNEDKYITPDDVVTIFDTLFLHMQQVLAQLSQQIQQIQAAGQMIPEAQLRQLLKAEFERALLACQGKVFEEHDVDEDCLQEATMELLSDPEKYPKVLRSVERFQKLYENVSGESVTGSGSGSEGRSKGATMTQDKLLIAASKYFDALTEAMREIVDRFKAQGSNLNDISVAQQIHMQFAAVANDAGEEALAKLDMTLDNFRAAIEKYSGNPEVGRTLTMLQMKQQQELMKMGVPMM